MPSDLAHVPFSKYSGAGNDFAIVVAGDLAGTDPADLARIICPRSSGVGVDGLIIVEPAGDRRVAARFFNPDGSEFSTCGNGTRCVARFSIRRGLVSGAPLDIRTGAGEVRAQVTEQTVSLAYEMEVRVERAVEVPYGAASRTGWLVRVGTPHLVLPVERVPEGKIEALAKPIRHLATFAPSGANVDLVTVTGPGDVVIRTYERGVEGETLACGSGAMATAVALLEAGLCGPDLILHTRSGAALEVALLDEIADVDPESGRRRVRLTGPALRLFDGQYPIQVE